MIEKDLHKAAFARALTYVHVYVVLLLSMQGMWTAAAVVGIPLIPHFFLQGMQTAKRMKNE